MSIEHLLILAGALHFALLPVSIAVPIVLDWKHHLLTLAPFTRRIVWVHGVFIVFTIIGFGVVTLVGAGEMAAGSKTAGAVAGFIGLFWLARLVVQLFFYPEEQWPKGWWAVLGRYATTALFAFWSAIFLMVSGAALCLQIWRN